MTETYLSGQPESAPGSPSSRRTDPYLVVEDLTVSFPTADGVVQAVSELSYTLEQGKTLGIVGESGSGKSVSSMAIMGLHDYKRTKMSGSIRVGGQEVIGLSNNQMRTIRGADVAMIFQDPLTALHPFYSVGKQIMESYQAHNDVSKSQARAKAAPCGPTVTARRFCCDERNRPDSRAPLGAYAGRSPAADP